ncbi:MAG: hypothetical protein K2H34_00430 [Lachnospiraceae bacterium]|nr:hypothetical protein [Lachnospiraceae bacterium]
MKNQYRKFYLLSLLILTALSLYPIYMGITAFFTYSQNGFLQSEEYPKYIIPYTPMCIAIIAAALLLPVCYHFSKRFAALLDAVIGVSLFLGGELFFEQIKVMDSLQTLPLDSWQYSLCVATPEVLRSIGEPIYARNNPAYKLHFYLIAIVIILSVIGILYGFTRMLKEGLVKSRKSLIVQTICTVMFISLCILACFTAFYRNGTRYISPLSACLTGLFFIVFGVTFGSCFSCWMHGKKRLLSIWLPVLVSTATTIVMYIGEFVLMDGALFVFGKGVFFEPLGRIPFSPCDIAIVLVTAGISYILNRLVNKE